MKRNYTNHVLSALLQVPHGKIIRKDLLKIVARKKKLRLVVEG